MHQLCPFPTPINPGSLQELEPYLTYPIKRISFLSLKESQVLGIKSPLLSPPTAAPSHFHLPSPLPKATHPGLALLALADSYSGNTTPLVLPWTNL